MNGIDRMSALHQIATEATFPASGAKGHNLTHAVQQTGPLFDYLVGT
jgi:hypothetical protein